MAAASALATAKLSLKGHAPVLPQRATGSAATSPAVSSGGNMKRRPESDVLIIARRMLRVPPSQRSVVLNARNRDGDTLLHASCKAGHSLVVSELLLRGSPELDIDAQTSGGFTALAYASRGGFQDICAMLVASGAETHVLSGADHARFQPVNQEKRALVHEAVIHGAETYAHALRHTLLEGTEAGEPFSRTPEVLIDLIVEYVLGSAVTKSVIAQAKRQQQQQQQLG